MKFIVMYMLKGSVQGGRELAIGHC